jgi:hypothetical protein
MNSKNHLSDYLRCLRALQMLTAEELLSLETASGDPSAREPVLWAPGSIYAHS